MAVPPTMPTIQAITISNTNSKWLATTPCTNNSKNQWCQQQKQHKQQANVTNNEAKKAVSIRPKTS